MFADDVARLRRLEDKLSGQMATVALLSGVASVVGGAAVSQSNVSALILVGGSFMWLVSAGVLVLEGSPKQGLRVGSCCLYADSAASRRDRRSSITMAPIFANRTGNQFKLSPRAAANGT